MADFLYLDVPHCPRCGQAHRVIAFKPFIRPPAEDEGLSHWGYCPVSGDPILLCEMEGQSETPTPPVDVWLDGVAERYGNWPVEPGYTLTIREAELESEGSDDGPTNGDP